KKTELGRTTEPVEVFAKAGLDKRLPAQATALSLGPEMSHLSDSVFGSLSRTVPPSETAPPSVILIGPKQTLDDLNADKPVRHLVEAGATAIVFSPSNQIAKLFPEDILDVKSGMSEFADMA